MPPPGRHRRNPILAALMLIFGAIMLLPGLCSVIFIVFGVSNPRNLANSGLFNFLLPLWVISFLITAGGVVLIRRVFR
jgi:hypothetical protein